MRILFLGAGAVGGYFGGRMAEAGSNVTFLVRPGRADQLAGGLKIESPRGNATIPVKALVPGDSADHFDVIILTCKSYGLKDALESIAPYVSVGTAILPFLNGFDHLDMLEARFPGATVWGGVAGISATLTSDGVVRQMHPNQALTLGRRLAAGPGEPDIDELAKAMTAAEISTRMSSKIEQEMWDKWSFLATLAAATCLMRGAVGRILAADRGEAWLRTLFDECLRTAAAEGFPMSADPAQDYSGILFDRDSAVTASMLRDIEADAPTEADHIIGAMIRRAERHGIETPLLRTANMQLQVYEMNRSG